jgi:NADH-quinone oxidoreductase subunit J
METTLFLVFGGISVAAALSVVLMRRVFYSALSLIVCLTSVSALYMLLQAPFIAAVQVIVYAGAIMVLFLFVIMLLDPFSSAVLKDKKKYLGILAVLLGVAGLLMLFPLLTSYRPGVATPAGRAEAAGSVASIGTALFNQYTLPFEVTSILILVAIIGTVVLARRQS